MSARLVASCEPDYPGLLAQIDPGPPLVSLPGSRLDRRSRGSHALLTQGAIVVASAAEVAEALKATPRPGASLLRKSPGLLSLTPMHTNDLACIFGAPAGVVAGVVAGAVTERRAARRSFKAATRRLQARRAAAEATLRPPPETSAPHDLRRPGRTSALGRGPWPR